MYNPREAAEDGHALNLAILFFAAFFVTVIIYFHYDSGLKYWLLRAFGSTAQGTVVELIPAPEEHAALRARAQESPKNTFKNISDWIAGDQLKISYTVEGIPHFLVFLPHLEADEILAVKSFPVTYLPANPKIAYPADYLSSLSFDGKVIIGAAIAGLIILLLGIRSAKKWKRFRQKMHRY